VEFVVGDKCFAYRRKLIGECTILLTAVIKYRELDWAVFRHLVILASVLRLSPVVVARMSSF